MIMSCAELEIVDGRQAAFQQAFARACEVIAQANGFISLRLGQDVGSRSHYLLIIEWETLESQTVGFRESDGFARWRELISPYFASPPKVEHLQPVASS